MKKLEDVSAEYSKLTLRQADLINRQREINTEIARLHSELGQQAASNSHEARVSALLAGVEVVLPTPIRDRLAELAAEERAVDTAIRELSGRVATERLAASRLIVAEYQPHREALAREFFAAIAKAADAQVRFFALQKEFVGAGVDPSGFHDFGEALFGSAGYGQADHARLIAEVLMAA